MNSSASATTTVSQSTHSRYPISASKHSSTKMSRHWTFREDYDLGTALGIVQEASDL